MNSIVPLIAAVVSFVFALAVLDQFLGQRKPHQLVWCIGLLIYCAATASEFWIGGFGLNIAAYRLWYVCGAVFSAAYLGMGTLYLLAPRKIGHKIMLVLLAASVFAVFRVITADVNLDVLAPGEPLTGEAFPGGFDGPRLLTPFFNVFGSLALVGGAAYSAFVFWKHREKAYRVVSNALIAVGAFFPVIGGSLARAGSPDFLYLSELLGIIIIFIGFLRSREVFGLVRVPLIHRRSSKGKSG